MGFVSFRLGVVYGSLTLQAEWTREYAFVINATHNSLLHHPPNFTQVFPNLRTLTLLHILPKSMSRLLAPCHDFLHGVQRVQLCAVSSILLGNLRVRNGTSTNTIYNPFVEEAAVGLPNCKLHSVRVKGKECSRFPVYGDIALRLENTKDGNIRHVAFSSSRKRTIKRNVESLGFRMTLLILDGCSLWPHCMTA